MVDSNDNPYQHHVFRFVSLTVISLAIVVEFILMVRNKGMINVKMGIILGDVNGKMNLFPNKMMIVLMVKYRR